MLNDGYQDLIFGNSGCTFNSATFTAQVKVEPSGLSGQTTFFTTTQLNVAPSDNLYYDTITTLLYGVPGVTSVIVNPQTNQITIQTNGTNPALLNQSIVIDLVINYDISCLS
jgi:copper chaperone CopZ